MNIKVDINTGEPIKSTEVQKRMQEEFQKFDEALSWAHDMVHYSHLVSADQYEEAFKRVEDRAIALGTSLLQIAYVCEFDLIAGIRQRNT